MTTDKQEMKPKAKKGKQPVVMIGDVYRRDAITKICPIEEAIQMFIEENGEQYDIYLTSRYPYDQREIRNNKVQKMIKQVYEGDVMPALKIMSEDEKDGGKEAFENAKIIMTCNGAGTRDALEKLVAKSPIFQKEVAKAKSFKVEAI